MWDACLFLIAAAAAPCLPEELGRLPPLSEGNAAPPAPPAAAAISPVPAALAGGETAHYRILYGIFGQLGEVTITLPGDASAHSLQAHGEGRGSLLGFGQLEKRIVSDFDPQRAQTTGWTSFRRQGGETVFDSVAEAQSGTVDLNRRREGKPDQRERFSRAQPVLDPVGFLLRMRVHPPTVTERFEVLDGRFLWRLTVSAGVPELLPDGSHPPARKFHGKIEPLAWNGQPDPGRDTREFTLWLADDSRRVPLRLTMPVGPGEVRVDLVSLDRTTPAAVATGQPSQGNP